MKPLAWVGVVLIVLGVLALVYQGVSYKQRETVVDVGPVHAEANREKTIPLPPIVGACGIAGGLVLLVVGTRSRQQS
jgi:hypothetical protein